MNQEVFAALTDALQRGEEVALVTITASTGSTPQRVGAKMLVFADGRTVGTIGGGCYENDAFGKARHAITTRAPQLVHYVIGAGHVGFHLARVAHEVGFRVHVVDDREKFANAERFPSATEILVEDIPAWI